MSNLGKAFIRWSIVVLIVWGAILFSFQGNAAVIGIGIIAAGLVMVAVALIAIGITRGEEDDDE